MHHVASFLLQHPGSPSSPRPSFLPSSTRFLPFLSLPPGHAGSALSALQWGVHQTFKGSNGRRRFSKSRLAYCATSIRSITEECLPCAAALCSNIFEMLYQCSSSEQPTVGQLRL
mmetsp:Transcript_46454/g.91672  ORF Transcript_46454/g.91672 Transcript_46454/m.91672 type:complete len:115 (+) Transcript_46454:2023-2367(+)